MVKNPPAIRETRVRSLGCKDPLEECMTTHSSYVLPGESPWIEEPGELQCPQGHKELDTTKQLSTTQAYTLDIYIIQSSSYDSMGINTTFNYRAA